MKDLSFSEVESKVIVLKIISGWIAGGIIFFSKNNFLLISESYFLSKLNFYLRFPECNWFGRILDDSCRWNLFNVRLFKL